MTEPSDDFDFDKEYQDAIDPAWKANLDLNQAKEPRKNLFNACVALRCHPHMAGRLAYDEFRGCTFARGPLPWDDQANRPWSPMDDLAVTEWLQSLEIGVGVGSTVAREAVERVAYERRVHPVLEYLEDLEWDGIKRLGSWLTTYLGATNSPLNKAFGRAFLISAVARVMKPGCKVDHMPILEGRQGTQKSKALRTLVGDEWFTDQITDLGTKDSCQDLRGVWVIELSELSAIRPNEVERVKAFISRQVDHYRPSYGRRSVDFKRQGVFIGTTNAHEYLTDDTGNRRFWPVACGVVDIEALARDRDQLWAEAVVAYHAGEQWWLERDELREAARREQELRLIDDPWEATIADWLEHPRKQPGPEDGERKPILLDHTDGYVQVTNAQILEHAIGKPTERQVKADQMRVGKILQRLQWKKHKSDGRIVWRKPLGIPDDKVSLSGVPEKTGANGAFQEFRDTRDTCSAHAHEEPRPENPKSEEGVQGVPGIPETHDNAGKLNGFAPERIGSCTRCRDAVHSDEASTIEAGEVLHHRCTAPGSRP